MRQFFFFFGNSSSLDTKSMDLQLEIYNYKIKINKRKNGKLLYFKSFIIWIFKPLKMDDLCTNVYL